MAAPNSHVLVLDHATNGPKTIDLWTFPHAVLASQVAASSIYYFLYGNNAVTDIQSSMQWSYYFFEKNVEPKLYSRINTAFLCYKPTAQCSALFFKLLIDILAVSNESHLIALQDWIYKFSIKDDVDGEDIIEAASLLKGIVFAIYSTKDNSLR